MKIAPDEEVPFDEFSRACDLVESYFEETIDEVALHAAVSRFQLVAILARAQLSGRQLAIEGLVEQGEVVFRSSRETLLWLDDDFWTDVRGRHHLEPAESRAAREVHRRLLEVIEGDVAAANRERDPFVLIERFDLYE